MKAKDMNTDRGSPGFAKNSTLHSLDYLKEKIKILLPELSPRLYAIGEYFLYKPENVAFLSIREVASEVGISQSSVMRFCTLLGYDGYASLVREIQQTIQAELGSYGKFELASQLKAIKGKGNTTLELIVMDEIENLTDIIKNVKLDEFDRCVKMINRADHVVVIGCMLSKMLAYYLHMGLSKIVKSTHLITYHEVDVDYIARKLSNKSVVIAVSFPRYPKSHYEITGIMAQRGAKVVTITNSPASPVIPFSDIVFYLSNNIDSFTEAFAAPLVFIEALLSSLSQQNPEETNKNLISYDKYDLVYKFENTPSYEFERSQKNGAKKSRQKRKSNSIKKK
jgi:DNA-binding MurR/RpiR family transcriptional regulator